MDVLEHIQPTDEKVFLRNLVKSLGPQGSAVIGMPSIYSQTYASPPSKAGHVNCKDGKDLRNLLKEFFQNVFLFCMNDEVVHTGFIPMAHYYLALCAAPRTDLV
jgi:2-polyprenyl-3-methyl-5-hydroxy-6-metoxy-1,4-benzoquinol methylase